MDWLERRKESSVIKKLRDHVSKVLDTAIDLDRAFNMLVVGKKNGIEEALKRVDMDESAADNIESALFEELTRGDMDPKEREDLMRLVRRIDDIADWLKVSGRNLTLMLEVGGKVSQAIWSSFKEMTKNTVDCCRALRLTIEALGHDKEEIFRANREVNKYERIVDDLYFGVKVSLVKELDDARLVVVLNDLLVGIENATDSCKAAAESVYIVSMGGHI